MNFTQQFFAVLALKRSRMSMCKYITINNCFTQRNSAVFVSALDARGGAFFKGAFVLGRHLSGEGHL